MKEFTERAIFFTVIGILVIAINAAVIAGAVWLVVKILQAMGVL
jgi:hypothetical protein